MRIIVSGIPEGGLEERLKIPLVISDIELKEEVQVLLNVVKFGDKVIVRGEASSEVSLACSRCLVNFSFPVKVDFDVEYVPEREFTKIEEHELTKGELDITFYRDDEIDIDELLREQILLAIPMKPLCSADCKGLCPSCGKNLNEDKCICSVEAIDPRLAVLKRLKESLKNNK